MKMLRSSAAILSGLLLFSATSHTHAENLSQIYQLAVENDAILQAAVANSAAADDGIKLADAASLPQINASASAGWSNHDFDDANNFNDIDQENINTLSLGLTQQLYNQGTGINQEMAELKAMQSDSLVAASEQDLLLRTSRAYFAILHAEDNLRLIRDRKSAFSEQYAQAERRYNAGAVALTDVQDAQARYDAAVADEITAVNRLDNAREKLRVITGHYHENLDPLPETDLSQFSPQIGDVEDWVNTALDNTPDLQASKLGVEVAAKNVDLAESERMPTVDLYARQYFRDSNISEGSSTDIGVQVSIPLYTGGAISANSSKASNEHAVSQQQHETVYRLIQQRVRDAFNRVNASYSAMQAAEQALVSASTALRATESGYQAGSRTIVDVLNSTQAKSEAEQRYAASRYRLVLSHLELKRYAGILAKDNLENVNQLLESQI